MIEERIQYGIDNFLEDNFFLPFSNSYCLEEKSETGRSKLHVDVQGDNLTYCATSNRLCENL